MKIGILSDTHNHNGNLQKALTVFRDHGIQTLIHCGDMSTPETAGHLQGFRVIYVYGNVDGAPEQIKSTLQKLNGDNEAGLTFSGRLGGVPVAAAHGHHEKELEDLIQDGRYRYVFHGHTHRRRDEKVGQTRVINPGALGGTRHETRSICLLDLEAGAARFIDIADR